VSLVTRFMHQSLPVVTPFCSLQKSSLAEDRHRQDTRWVRITDTPLTPLARGERPFPSACPLQSPLKDVTHFVSAVLYLKHEDLLGRL
jgi:hypothetical protein